MLDSEKQAISRNVMNKKGKQGSKQSLSKEALADMNKKNKTKSRRGSVRTNQELEVFRNN